MKTENIKNACLSVFASFFIISCSSTAYIEKDENVKLENYKSFTWLHGEDSKLQNHSELSEAKIRSAVSTELQKSGWKEIKTKPDVILDYDVYVEKASKEKKEPVYSQPYTRLIYNPYTRRYSSIYYPSRFIGYESQQELVKEGTITITMIDAKTDKMIWQGWTTAEVNSENLTSKEIQKAVNSIFKKFDVAKR